MDDLSLWEFHCVADGLHAFHGGGRTKTPEITDEDDEIWKEMGLTFDG